MKGQNGRRRLIPMNEGEKQALRNSFAGKKVTEMTPQERELFDKEFQYGFARKSNSKLDPPKSKPWSKPKDFTMGFLSRMNFIVKK